MRWILALITVAGGVLAAGFLLLARGQHTEPRVLPQDAMPGRLLVGLQDDPSFRWAPDRAQMLDRARDAHISLIRTVVVWRDAAPRRPAQPSDPFDPAYRLDDLDDLVRSAQQRGIELLISIWGTPAWANGNQTPNRPPRDPRALEHFAAALAARYSGRHSGFPAIRLFSAWNEPNLEQFLAPQFDGAGRSVGPALYAALARAVYDGVKRGNPEALVAIGETSPRGHDVPGGRVQESHSPARFARLLSEVDPEVEFDAWAQHPYPPRPKLAPERAVRWPRVGMGNLERFGEALDEWFGRDDTPIWITEYAHETLPPEPLGIDPELQAQYAEDALRLAAENPRVRLFVWFVFRDREDGLWQSGLLREDYTPKPALAPFAAVAEGLDGRNPVLPESVEVARVPALELAYYVPPGTSIDVTVDGARTPAVPLERDGWLEVPLVDSERGEVDVRVTDPHGHALSRTVRIGDETIEVD
jgi:Cellulase (glycosyl hydrolase family 5)